MNKSLKRLLVIDLSSATAREVTDALVIFSMAILTYMSIAEWGGLTLLHNVLGIEPVKPSFLYFFGVALVLFSTRRIGDQRQERAKRLAAERHAQAASMRDPLTQLPNRRQFQSDVSAALKKADNKMSVLLLGLDQFKKLNEVYGHVGCDEALAQVGRESAIAPQRATFLRGSATMSLRDAWQAATPKLRAGLPVRWSRSSKSPCKSALSITASAPALYCASRPRPHDR